MLHLQKPPSSASGGYKSAAGATARGDLLLPPHSFLDPFSPELWASLAAAYVLTSLTLFFVARVSPYERRATVREGAAAASCFGTDGFSLCNAFWYTFAGFCMRGSNIAANVSDQRTSTVIGARMSHWKWRETKLQPSRARSGLLLSFPPFPVRHPGADHGTLNQGSLGNGSPFSRRRESSAYYKIRRLDLNG